MIEERSEERGQRDDPLIDEARNERRDDPLLLSRAREIFGDALTLVVLTGKTGVEQESAPTVHTRHKVKGRESGPTSGPEVDVALGALSDRQNARSLLTAVDIADELLKVEAKSTVQAWFVGQNPLLNERSPALTVRTDPDAVWDAAKHFVAYG